MTHVTPFSTADVRGFLHQPATANQVGLVLTHGAGSNCDAPLLVEAANAFGAAGVCVLRFDLPFRRQRATGPPSRSAAAADRAGIRRAVLVMRDIVNGRVIVAGHSYGGRQASMLAAEEADLASALLLLSYPLHPPKKPEQLRTEHFPRLRTRVVFVHGTRDAFGSIDELEVAVGTIPASTHVIHAEGAGHDLKRGRIDMATIVNKVLEVRNKTIVREAAAGS